MLRKGENANETICASLEKTAQKLRFIKKLLRAVLFDNYDLDRLNHFIGVEPLCAIETLTTATDTVALGNRS